jgi:hypothetical protein
MQIKAKTIILLIFITGISCKKENTDKSLIYSDLNSPLGSNVKINGSIKILDEGFTTRSNQSLRKISSLGGSLISSVNGDKIGAVHIDNNNFWKDTDRPGMTINGYADEFTMTPEWLGRLDVFHLGSLLKGNSISNLSFIPLSEREGHYTPKPISASVSFPSKTVSGSFLPDVMATSEFFGELMRKNGLVSEQKSNFSYEIREFSYYNEVKTAFGSNVDIKALFFKSGNSGSTASDRISKRSGLIASFTQKNFSVDMDIPESGELLENLNTGVLEGVSPAYINSVIYGSKGVILIESDSETETIKSTFTKAFSVMGGLVAGTQNMTAEENEIISKSDLQIFFIGPNGEQTIKKLNSIEELIKFVRTGTSFSPSSPGVPIAFKMRAFNTHETIRNIFSIDILFRPFYIKSEFVLNPSQENSRRHELHLSFYADKKGSIPIQVPSGVPIFAETKFLRYERSGSHRDGFTITPIFGPEAHYNVNQGNKMIIKPVLLINEASTSPDGSYNLIP